MKASSGISRHKRLKVILLGGACAAALAAQASNAQAQAVFISGEGAFHSDEESANGYTPVYQSTWAQPCEIEVNADGKLGAWHMSNYYEDVDWFRNPSTAPGTFFPQAQCQLRGTGFGYAPQVISCGDQGHCLRFATAAGSSPNWNRSELAIANEVPLRTTHYVALKFKFPNSIGNPAGCKTEANGQTNYERCPYFAQVFWQPGAPSGGIGGLRLVETNDGSHKWLFEVVHNKSNVSGPTSRLWRAPCVATLAQALPTPA